MNFSALLLMGPHGQMPLSRGKSLLGSPLSTMNAARARSVPSEWTCRSPETASRTFVGIGRLAALRPAAGFAADVCSRACRPTRRQRFRVRWSQIGRRLPGRCDGDQRGPGLVDEVHAGCLLDGSADYGRLVTDRPRNEGPLTPHSSDARTSSEPPRSSQLTSTPPAEQATTLLLASASATLQPPAAPDRALAAARYIHS